MPRLVGSLNMEISPAASSFARSVPLRSKPELHALAVLIAAERHGLAHGSFPRDLAEIDPRYLRDPLIDPYSGRPIRFRPSTARA